MASDRLLAEKKDVVDNCTFDQDTACRVLPTGQSARV